MANFRRQHGERKLSFSFSYKSLNKEYYDDEIWSGVIKSNIARTALR